MVEKMNFPQFQYEDRPTMREANDRIMYFATNWQKTHTGNPVYGKAVYVMNPLYKDKWFIAPYDTGEHVWDLPTTPFGTLDHFWHLFVPHLTVYNYNVGDLFWRWYGGAPVIDLKGSDFFYFEVNLAGNAWLPDALLYFVAIYDELWGTQEGTKIQIWAYRHKRPVVWANGDDSGELGREVGFYSRGGGGG